MGAIFKAALESRGSGAASFLDHTLLRVDTVLLSPALLSTMLSVDKSSKRDILIIADSSSESVVPFVGSRWENPTSIRRHTTVEQWVQTLMKGRVLLAPAAWFGLLGRSLLNIAPAVTCAYRKRPKLDVSFSFHLWPASSPCQSRKFRVSILSVQLCQGSIAVSKPLYF